MRRAGRDTPGGTRPGPRPFRGALRAARRRGQALEEYLLILGLVVLPLLAALPAAVAAIQGWMARMTGWWGLPVP